jgi:streptogramin lyase
MRPGTILLSGLLLAAVAATPGAEDPRSSEWLTLLPDGEAKRQFILDCTGCHQFDATIVRPNGQPRTREDFEAAVTRMLSFSGATTGFPVIGHGRVAAPTAAWLAPLITRTPVVAARPPLPAGASVTEYDLPEARDLAHDVAIDSSGRVIVTGMMTHEMLVLDTTTRRFSSVAIPVNKANPRAVEVDSHGDWWVVLGAPNAVAKFNSITSRWSVHEVGMYAHSVALDSAGNAYVNGHFTSDPVKVKRIARDGTQASFDLPRHPVLSNAPGGPIPYEIRVAPNGIVWVSELSGNRLVSLNPATRQTRAYDMPMTHSGPRRFDIDRNGMLWIPAYSGNELVKLDPSTGAFTRYPLPVPDGLPYVAKADPKRGVIWVGSGSADIVWSFDPATTRFTAYPLPSRGAMVRHLAIDGAGDVWVAYGASPGRIPSRIARLRLGA